MAKRKRRDRPAGPPKRKQPAKRRAPREPDLMDVIADALDDGSPIALLGLASSLMSAVDPRSPDTLDDSGEPEATLDEMVEAFSSAPVMETSALLTGIAALSGDDVLRKRVAREVAGRAHALPAWLSNIARTKAEAHAVELVDVFGDQSEIIVGAALPDGQALTAVVSVAHNAGSVAADGFLVPGSIDAVVAGGLDGADGGDLTARPLAPADARARITEAIRSGLLIDPPPETETWPSARPSVEWLVGLLPEGGSGFPRAERWDDAALDDLELRFWASPFAEHLDEPGDLAMELLLFGTDHGPGDPLRWTPVSAEMFLLDWIPRRSLAEPADLEAAPDLLRAFVRFSHHERGLPAELTERTIAAIDAMVPEYQELIRSDS